MCGSKKFIKGNKCLRKEEGRALGGKGKLSGGKTGVILNEGEGKRRAEGTKEGRRKNAWREGEGRKVG